MKILISNDDGIESPGIAALAKAASRFGEITVVAPHRERSTSGHSLTLHKPLRVFSRAPGWYATTGSPADCIYLGIREILKARPDVILSGINRGANLGSDVHYSGTVAAAREGALQNIKSYAFSLVEFPKADPDLPAKPWPFEEAAEYVEKVLEKTLSLTFPSHTLLNVNIPPVSSNSVRGIKVARQGFRYYSDQVTRRTDPRGREYYWIGGEYSGFEKIEGSDCDLVEGGHVVVTPVTIDCTHQGFFKELQASQVEG